MTIGKGYAFIELMATIAIVSIMTAVVLNSLSSPRAKKSVEMEARSLAAAIREAQSYALSGKQEGTDPVCGWGINYNTHIDVDPHKYTLFYNKGSDCNDVNVKKYYIPPEDSGSDSANSNVYTLNGRIRFLPDNLENSIYFKIPYGNIYIFTDKTGLSTNETKIQLVSEIDANEKYSVCVYPSGMVTEKAGDTGC